jgi:hypothetical protein
VRKSASAKPVVSMINGMQLAVVPVRKSGDPANRRCNRNFQRVQRSSQQVVICHKVSTEGSPLSSHKERALPANGVRKEPLQVLDGHAEQVERDLVVLENVERGRYSKPKVGKGIAEKPDRTKGVVLCLPPPPERVPWPRRRGDVIEELVLVVDTRETTVQIVL